MPKMTYSFELAANKGTVNARISNFFKKLADPSNTDVQKLDKTKNVTANGVTGGIVYFGEVNYPSIVKMIEDVTKVAEKADQKIAKFKAEMK